MIQPLFRLSWRCVVRIVLSKFMARHVDLVRQGSPACLSEVPESVVVEDGRGPDRN
jgi:hypothetical protein